MQTMQTIDLNCDMGELPEAIAEGTQEALLRSITSANVACGGHAGDAQTMRTTIEQALRAGVAVGAHPGYPDRANFGRLELNLPLDEIADSVSEQVRALAEIAAACGAKLAHVKPHGALYNQAIKDRALAAAIAAGVAAAIGAEKNAWSKGLGLDLPDSTVDCHPGRSQNVVIPSGASAIRNASGTGEVEGSAFLWSQAEPLQHDVVLVGLAGSPMLDVFRQARFPVAAEAFADRRYEPDGTLRSRKFDDALIRDPAEAARQALSIAERGIVTAHDGTEVKLAAQTICIHGDTPGATHIAAAVASALRASGLALRSL